MRGQKGVKDPRILGFEDFVTRILLLCGIPQSNLRSGMDS
jgi:hypothetical protein